MPTKTPREIEDKLEEIKYNFLNYNGVHTKEYMYDFLVTKPMLALLEEARQEIKNKISIEVQERVDSGNNIIDIEFEEFINSL